MLLQPLPSEIVGIPVETNHMVWVRKVARVIQSRELMFTDKVDIIIQNLFLPEDWPRSEDGLRALFLAVMDFYNCGKEDRGLKEPKETMLHWERDSAAIWGDFKVYANLDLDNAELHWWEFNAIFDSLPPHSQIKRLMQTRAEDEADYRGSGMEKYRADLRERKRAAAVWPDVFFDDEYDFAMAGSGD